MPLRIDVSLNVWAWPPPFRACELTATIAMTHHCQFAEKWDHCWPVRRSRTMFNIFALPGPANLMKVPNDTTGPLWPPPVGHAQTARARGVIRSGPAIVSPPRSLETAPIGTAAMYAGYRLNDTFAPLRLQVLALLFGLLVGLIVGMVGLATAGLAAGQAAGHAG